MRRLVVVSNRVSVPGDSTKRAGGLEVALRPLMQNKGGVWLGWSGKVAPADQIETRCIRHKNVDHVVADLSQEDFDEYYKGFANRVLWPILHYRPDLAEYAGRDLRGYFRVNAHFATKLDAVIADDDLIWVHDYHLIPFADAMRRRGCRNRMGFFLHVPFPPPEIMTSLPGHEQLFPLLAKYDVVGFQTEGDAQNFMRYLASECPQLQPLHSAERTDCTVVMGKDGHQILVGSFPVSIEPRAFARMARRNVRSPLVEKLVASLGGRNLVIGVDRLDYTKGLIQRFDAFEFFLKSQSELQGSVTYLQIVPRNRSDIPEYAEHEEALRAAAGRINGQYGEVSWTPIRYVNRVYSRSALAGLYRTARVGLVTPLRDGMNLVAKEYVAAQDPENPGVLILSRFAGAAVGLQNALLVNPADTESVAGALAQALAMPLAERRERHAALFANLCDYDIDRWHREFLAALHGPPDMQASSGAVAIDDADWPRSSAA